MTLPPVIATIALTTVRRVLMRWVVHLLLIATAVLSLVMEPVLTLHVVLGLAFVVLVAVHLLQRRTTSVRLLQNLIRYGGLGRRSSRLAAADALLVLLTVAMLVSGLWDWAAGQPTHIRWHAITGVVLAAYLVVHTFRRRARLRRSRIR